MIGIAMMQTKTGVRCPLNSSAPRTYRKELNAPVINTPQRGQPRSILITRSQATTAIDRTPTTI